MKLSPWYPPEVKPVREGVYQRPMHGEIGYACWVFGRWSVNCTSAYYAMRERSVLSSNQNVPWRGKSKP